MPSGGMMMFSTSEETILPKAAPTMTPTAMSTTLPFMANSLKSAPMPMSHLPERRLGGFTSW